MINEHKYPFKWMQKSIDWFDISDKPITSFQLGRKIGSCSSDAREVVKMLAYLTQFGQVVSNGEKWKIEQITTNKDLTPKGFRAHYLRELSVLLEYLSENPARLEDIVLNTNMSESDVSYNLNFLSSITRKGQLYLHRNRFPQQWGFRSWETKSST